ncbi:ERMES complex subunit [Linnemannia gamsii]|uniref:Mitochondrial distribution and morphology protein 34 n=1 Tax=Linnemannia gamsii TaxID=64522 RepID=A0A9P6RA48_9FUNG|nr:ERMES complex subunit [Linnemannia gamsii]
MAFRFQWPYFSEEFMQEAKTMLTNALNKGNKPAVIVDHITVKELDMGTLPPELEMLEMGELSMERFRGIFKLTYNGDAHIVLQTKVQANPMNVKKTDNPSYTRRGILAADQPLVVPMLLRISDFKLRGIIVLVVDQIKGITLVFKNDPLESVLVSSTFDSITPIQRFLQSEIEKQLRNLFQEDLPTAIHNLSQQFTKKPEDASRQQQQQQHQQEELQGRSIYDGGLATPSVSQNPSRRSSVIPPRKKTPGRTNSEPDYSMAAQYDNDGLRSVRKPTSATVRSESPGSGSRRDPHTEYSGDAQRDLLEESLSHESNNPTVSRRSQPPSRRSSRMSDRHDHVQAPAASTLERLSMRDETAQSLLGVAESTHLANQFERLTHSNQTISPFAQNLEHFAFRSVPPKRPASVQYYSHSGNNRIQSPGSRSGSNSVNGMDISKDGLGHLNHKAAGYPSGYGQYKSDLVGHGQSSPRISHRRLQGRVGIRRYAMQMGAGNGPRELSDQDSDEYNDVDEALSESEYVYVEKNPRPSSDFDRSGLHESRRLSPEEALQRDFTSMQMNGNKDNSYPSASLSPKVAPASTIQPNGNKAPPTTTARTFSNTQRPSAVSPRLPPPEPLKRDKRNSSILSSRRVSSVGIGLGVLSKEDDKRQASAAAVAAAGVSKATGSQTAANGMPRPSLYKTTPLTTHSGWFEREGT